MLDSSGLPTDNLYKFLAIAGLVIALLPAIYIDKENDRLWQDTYLVREQQIDLKFFVDNSVTTSAQVEHARMLLEKIKLKSEYLGKESERLKQRFFIGAIISIVGVVISSLGFCLWYVKTQSILDSILKKKC